MSNIYNLEPPTEGKVILHTTMGEIEIELWPKQAPMAVRNFVQLCMEGYYEGTLFHRVIEKFMVQGGDPTGTGTGGDSIYGKPFKDEFHSRLKFTHRGLMGCANQNAPNTNGSQFFITLDKCEDLNKRYTIFGRIMGDTIFNVLRIGEVVTDNDNRPVDPISVTGAEIVWNPFDDIVPRIKQHATEANKDAKEKERRKKKGKKDLKLLSFGEEAEAEEEAEQDGREGGLGFKAKMRSAHDVLHDEKLLGTESHEAVEIKAKEDAELEVRLKHVRNALKVLPEDKVDNDTQRQENDDQLGQAHEGDLTFDERMRQKVLAKKAKYTPTSETDPKEPILTKPDIDKVEASPNNDSELHKGPGMDRLQLKRKALKSEDVKDADLLTGSQAQHAKYKRRKQLHGSREKDTLAKLAKFQSILKSSGKSGGPSATLSKREDETEASNDNGGKEAREKVGYDGEVRSDIDHKMDMPAAWRVDDYLEGTDEVGLNDLKSHKLEFVQQSKDEMARRDDIDDYVVLDPLLEEGKSKFNKKVQQMKRKDREWTKMGKKR